MQDRVLERRCQGARDVLVARRRGLLDLHARCCKESVVRVRRARDETSGSELCLLDRLARPRRVRGCSGSETFVRRLLACSPVRLFSIEPPSDTERPLSRPLSGEGQLEKADGIPSASRGPCAALSTALFLATLALGRKDTRVPSSSIAQFCSPGRTRSSDRVARANGSERRRAAGRAACAA